MGQEILKKWQKKVIGFLAGLTDFNSSFYLTGGTALSVYYLQHRISEDIDFFSLRDIDTFFIHETAQKIKEVIGAQSMRFSRLYDRYQFFYELSFEEVKVEFSKYPFCQLKSSSSFDGIKVDSKYDIAVNKLAAIFDRFEPKDFVDLYFLLLEFSLGDLQEGIKKKFALKVEPLFLGSELSKVRRIEALPKMLKPLTLKTLKDFFADLVEKLSTKIIEE